MPSMAATHGGVLYYVVKVPKDEDAQVSTESGWDNPFRPGGDLSKEADEIVELIKDGKPLTPTPGSNAPTPGPMDEADQCNHVAGNGKGEPITQSPKKVTNLSTAPRSANGNYQNDTKTTPGAVEVQRGTIKPDGDASQVEHVTLKKKQKCKCCVIQ